MKRAICIGIAFLVVSCSSNDKNSILLGVDQKIKIPVEYVTISTGISVEDDNVTSVEKEGYDKLANVVELLNELGYEKDHLEINSGELTDYGYGENQYTYRSSVEFDLKNLDKIDEFRRLLTKAGVTSFDISSFNNSKEDSIYDAAYKEAIDKAKIKANGLLTNQALKVGNILNLQENVEETIEISSTRQMAEPPPSNYLAITGSEAVEPLFNKKFYTRNIEFTIEFSLLEQ